MKKNRIVFCIFVVCILFLTINLVEAKIEEDIINNIIIDVDSPSVIRVGNEFPLILRIINMNEDSYDSDLIVKDIKILNSKNKEIKNSNINKIPKSVKKEISDLNKIKQQIQKNPQMCKEKEFEEKMKKTTSILSEREFKESYILDIQNFYYYRLIGETIFIPIKVKINYVGKNFIIDTNHSILISEPLPSPSHNSPGWYRGDQHVHSNYSNNLADLVLHGGWCDTIPNQVSAAKSLGYDWLLFTEHSFAEGADDSPSWTKGGQECDNEDTSGFKCHYGLELSTDAPGICDSSHYLYYDSTPSFIEADCIAYTCCDVETEDVMDAVNNNGGIGFVAHPYGTTLEGVGFEWEEWDLTGFTGLELINGEFDGDDSDTINNPGGNTDSWIEFLESETNPDDGFKVGIANSDAHQVDEFSSFTYCYMDSLSESNIVSALEDGHCVASTGPFVSFTLDGTIIGDKATVPEGTNSLDIYANSTAEFGELSWIYIYINDTLEKALFLGGGSYSYSDSVDVSLSQEDGYIRLVAYTDENHRAYTNPIWIEVTSCSCGSWSEGSCDGGSCNSEQKQWTRSCTPAACASESKCVYDEDCEEEQESQTSECTEPGYEFCLESSYGDCDVSVAENLYSPVNDIQWGAVNDAHDPYVIGEYTVGWKDVDADQMYYDCDGDVDCEYGGCDCDEIADEDTMVTVTAPGTAYVEEILGYDDTPSNACWVWFYSHTPSYTNNPYIYVLNCFNDTDCSANQYCDKSSTWSNWNCVSDKSDGQSCTRDAQCDSGYCDNDGEGLTDDDHCFTPYNTYFDGQETSYCEYSTNEGIIYCDENSVGSDLDYCSGLSYREEECNSSCSNADVTSVFECDDASCSCSEFLCDGLTTGNTITTCSSEKTYFADKCTSTASGEDRGDNICRNSTFAADCTADLECGGIVAGTGDCTLNCISDDTHKFYIKNSSNDNVAWLGDEGNIVLNGTCTVSETCTPPANSFILENLSSDAVAYIDPYGNLCLESGTCDDNYVNCDNPGDGSFIVRNESDTNVAYINATGNLCLIGSLIENGDP